LITKQLSGNSKAIVPVTKNHNLGKSYNAEIVDSDGYESDFTHNSEGTFQFVVNSTIYDTTDNEDGEGVSEGTKLNVNAAAASTKPKKSVLKRRGKEIFKLSEIPAAAVARMMASEQVRMIDKNDNEMGWMTYAAKMTVIDYTRFDSMITEDSADKKIHCNANLSHAHEVEFIANLSKQDRIIGGKHLALADGGANGNIIALGMRIIYFNIDGKCVSIGIAGDHQLPGNRLCCGQQNQVMDGSSCIGIRERK